MFFFYCYCTSKECGECPYDTFWHFEAGTADRLKTEFFSAPGQCVLAAIRDEVARVGAMTAIPKGSVALTQGYVPIDDYVKWCKWANDKTDEEAIKNCDGYKWNEFFVNWEDSHVVSDNKCWTNVTFPVESNRVHAAIGGDGLLRAVSQLAGSVEAGGYDGAVYECCPTLTQICERAPPAESR